MISLSISSVQKYQKLIILFILFCLAGCKKEEEDECLTCSKYINGVDGFSVTEQREICDEVEAASLEASSEGRIFWECE